MSLFKVPESPKPRTAQEFADQYRQMLAFVPEEMYGDPGAFTVNRDAKQWAVRLAANTGRSEASVYNDAMLLGGFTLFATERGFQPFLASREPRIFRALPDLTHQPAEDDVVRHLTPSTTAWSSLIWANGKGHESDRVVDAGIRVLGALAAMPPGSAVMINDLEGRTFDQHPTYDPRNAGITYPAGLELQPYRPVVAPRPPSA